MGKHLKLKAQRIFDEDVFIVKIVEQTHHLGEFGLDGYRSFTASNGVTIKSMEHPECQMTDTKIPFLFVRGDETSRDNDYFEIPASMMSKIIQAVREYNVAFSDTEVKDVSDDGFYIE